MDLIVELPESIPGYTAVVTFVDHLVTWFTSTLAKQPVVLVILLLCIWNLWCVVMAVLLI